MVVVVVVVVQMMMAMVMVYPMYVEVVVVVRMGAIRILRPLVCGVGEGTTQMLCCCWETAKGFGSRDICTTQTGAYVCSV